jgi:dyslexia susceptibility 1 candidate gene 1 protein
VWLKAKGDDFFRSGDTHSAINAYSAAVDADERMVACLSNRSACYLKLNMNLECRLDCDKAIEIVNEEIMAEEIASMEDEASSTPACSNWTVMLLKLLVRRGVAQCNLGMFPEALSDYTQANAKFLRMNGTQIGKLAKGEISPESLEKDVARLKLLHTADQLKREADALFADGQVREAANKYGDALALIPVYVSCLSNRSACRMTLGDLTGCVEDCSAAVTLLQVDPNKGFAGSVSGKKGVRVSEGAMNMLQTILPAAGSDKRRTWLVKTLTRRGVAFSKMEEINSSSGSSSSSGGGSDGSGEWNLDKAVKDFAQACAIDPANEALKSDLNKLKSFREFKKKQALEKEANGAAGGSEQKQEVVSQ